MEKVTMSPVVISMYTVDNHTTNSLNEQNGHSNKYRNITDPAIFEYIPEIDLTFRHNKEHKAYDKQGNDLNYISHGVKDKINRTNTLLAPVTVVINFTNSYITIRDSSNIPKQILNISTNNSYKNKIYVLTLHNINNPNSGFYNNFDSNNYLETLIANNRKSGNLANEELIAIYEYYNKHFNDITEERDNPTLKVVVGYVIDSSILETVEDRTIYLTNKDLVISLKNIITTPEHPRTDILFNAINEKDMKSIEDNTLSFFIVDNNHKVTKKFFNILNKPIEIPKISSDSCKDGLYLKGKLNGKLIEDFCPLLELANIKYVYNSEEEAMLSGDIELHLKKEISKLEHDNKKLSIDLEKAKIDSSYKQMDIETTKLHKKDHYETKKYERDTFVETLKTASATAVLLGGVYGVYLKFKK